MSFTILAYLGWLWTAICEASISYIIGFGNFCQIAGVKNNPFLLPLYPHSNIVNSCLTFLHDPCSGLELHTWMYFKASWMFEVILFIFKWPFRVLLHMEIISISFCNIYWWKSNSFSHICNCPLHGLFLLEQLWMWYHWLFWKE